MISKINNVLKKRTFSALKHRNYRLWFFGQMISLFGSWMQIMAQGFLIFELTKSPAYLGYTGFAQGLPAWLFMLYGGLIADRFKRRTILVITQASLMLLSLILAFLTFTGWVQPWQILMLAFCVGIANSFDAPTRLAFLHELVSKNDITNAVALNSTMFNTATAMGPAAAGVIYALFGPAWCFTVNGFTYIAVIIALLMMKITHQVKETSTASKFSQMKAGLSYVFKHKIIRTLILLAGIFSLFGVSFITLVPAWSVNILKGDSTTNGLLLSSRGIGALIGSLFIATLGNFTYKGKMLIVNAFLFPLFLFIFSFITDITLSLITLLIAGLALVIVLNLSNALIQTHVDEKVRGRVMGIYTAVFFGFMPVGALIIGTLAEYFGEQTAAITGALTSAVFVLIILITVPEIRKE